MIKNKKWESCPAFGLKHWQWVIFEEQGGYIDTRGQSTVGEVLQVWGGVLIIKLWQKTWENWLGVARKILSRLSGIVSKQGM